MLRSDPKDAFEAFFNALQCNSRCAPLWNSIGISYLHLHQYDNALDAFSTARDLDPKNVLIWHNIGLLVSLYFHIYKLNTQELRQFDAVRPVYGIISDIHRRVIDLPQNNPEAAYRLLYSEHQIRRSYAENLLKTSMWEFDIASRLDTSSIKNTPWHSAHRVQCICGFEHVVEANAHCSGCKTRQHDSCYDYSSKNDPITMKNRSSPHVHLCIDCDPRRLDIQAAKIRQRQVASELLRRKIMIKAQLTESEESDTSSSSE